MIALGAKLIFCVTLPLLAGFVAGYLLCHLARTKATRRR